MASPSVSPIVAAIFTLIAFVLLARLVFADVSTSTSFHVGQSVNDFGASGTSSSFSSVTTGGQVVTGEATSTNFKLSSGFEYYDSFSPQSGTWRWYDDEGDETPTVALESENVAPVDIENSDALKLRIAVAETAGYGAANVKFKLQYSVTSDFSSGVHDVVEKNDCTGNSLWCYADGVDTDGDTITSALLSGVNACVNGSGNGCGTHNESGVTASTFTHHANALTEYEFTLQAAGAAVATTYFFRLYDIGADVGVPLTDGASYPSLVSGGSTLGFSIEGLPAATTTAGVTTDIDASSSDIPFGTLPIDAPRIAAQRLSVSTNASTGYEVYVFQPQGFLGEQGADITPISGTNDTPSAWSSACSASSPGCFGYHTSAPVLAGGSTRFAADDTYAQFSQSLSEIAFSGIPAASSTTDIVYKVEAHQLQAADSYSTTVSYIVVPVF